MSTITKLGAATQDNMERLIGPQVGRKDLAQAVGYRTNAGAPTSITPRFIGERLLDTSGSQFYIAFGTSSGNWSPMGDNTLSAAELAYLDGALDTNLVAGKAAITGTSGALTLGGSLTAVGSIIIGSADLNETDLEKLDGITNGTGASDKALVLDANGTVLLPAPLRYDVNTTITAFATGGQASATALTGEYNDVTTCATAGDSVKLPSAVGGESIVVKNSGVASLAVFPATSDSINALAVDLSVNIPVGGTLRFFAKSATVWETNEAVVLPAPTTQRGELVIKASDNAADHEIVLTNASFAQDSTLTIPDPGATGTFVMEELTNVFDLPQRYDANTTITAFATGGQASATALTGEFNNVTTVATAGDSVKLPAAAAGLKITVKNSGVASLAVFPATSDSINALAVDLSVNIPVGGELTFRAKDATVWETNEALVLSAPTTQSGELVIKAADNAADHEIVIVNASHGQATTHTVPDPGAAAASFVLTEGVQTVNGAKTFSNLSSVTVPAASAEHGAGAIGTSSFGAPQTRRWTEAGVIITQTKFDLTGLASGGTANDVVGLAAGGAAYIGRNVVATNGVIFKMEMSCLETPAGGDGDIDIVADTSAALIGDGAYTGAIKINGGTLVIGQTVQNLVPAVDANFYFYIAAVGAGGGTYTAGMFVLTTYGHAVL